MEPYNWKEFTRRIPIKASPKAIYDSWTTQQGLESWFLRLAAFTKRDGTARPRNSPVEAGDKYLWRWFGYDDSASEQNEILSVNGWDQLQFSFSGGCIVTVTVKQERGVTLCELQQQMPMENEAEQQYFFIECGNGWGFYLTNLKSVLEGGLDLRNRDMDIGKVITA